jgi:hypothetical protein
MLHSWLAPLQAFTLVASPRLGLQHKVSFLDLNQKTFSNYQTLNLHVVVDTCWCALSALANMHLLVFAMVPPMLPNNFKFKYFFCVQILVENLVPPILNPCDVLEIQ